MTAEFPLDASACRGRQNRLLEVMLAQDLDLVVVMQSPHVQWLSGAWFGWHFQPAAALFRDGLLAVVMPERRKVDAVADEVLTYEAQWHSTLRNDQRQASCEVLGRWLSGRPAARRVGVEYSSFSRHLHQLGACELVDIEPDLYRLRRRKDADELALMQKATLATEQMYLRAREILEPGISELEMFNQLQAAAVDELGEMLTGTGNDYQCGSRGGPPRRDRVAEAGELYILDLGPAFRGYFADNCRTLAVTSADHRQLEAWSLVTAVFGLVEREVRPGKSARELFQQAQMLLDTAKTGRFDHHLGHGLGLFPHEAPHLNPHWDDRFEQGDVFTVEPGLYAPELRAGMRIENNYRVTEDGVELLTDFPLEL
ncbi:MAG: aminopeptidase P family protein [Pirellulaceae bacterium]|nr:aminopeptidase P family protein [Pirellulaceae bacterium]